MPKGVLSLQIRAAGCAANNQARRHDGCRVVATAGSVAWRHGQHDGAGAILRLVGLLTFKGASREKTVSVHKMASVSRLNPLFRGGFQRLGSSVAVRQAPRFFKCAGRGFASYGKAPGGSFFKSDRWVKTVGTVGALANWMLPIAVSSLLASLLRLSRFLISFVHAYRQSCTLLARRTPSRLLTPQ